ncbi:MAG: DUF4493 domain-containing protein [Alistipes sp.]|nr:DUF4493 domain-containing protein [Alistipes sp.]
MKKYIKSLLFAVAALTMTACEIDKLSTPNDGTQSEEAGYLQIGQVAVNADTENNTSTQQPLTATRAVTEAAGTYYITVNEKTTGATVWQGTYAEAAQQISVEPGTYVVSARQSEDGFIEGVAKDAPYYAGQSEDVVVYSKQTSTTSVTCKLANILTTVELSADLKAVFKSYDSTSEKRLKTNVSVGTDALVNSYDFEASSTHSAPKMYFKDLAGLNSATGNTMTIVLSGDYYTGDPEDLANGTPDASKWKEVKMTKILTNVRAAQWRKISIDIDPNTTGNVKFTFTIESYVYDEEIAVDVTTLSETLAIEEEIPDDEENPAAPNVTINGQEELSYTIDSSMYDADAEAWTSFLKVNITPNDNTTVKEVYALVSASDNAELLAAVEAQFAKGRIDFYPTNAVSDYCNVAADGTTITVKGAGMSGLYKYAGTHTISVYTVDSQNRMKHTDLTITVSEGGSTGGAVPTIVWMKNGVDVIDQLHTLTSANASSFQCKVDMGSETGFTTLEVDIVSSVLTDEELQGVGLGSHIDLINPTEEQIGSLQGLGFLGEGVTSLKGEKSASFDISGFMGLLYGIFPSSDYCYFHITVGDANGTTKKSLQFYVDVE